MLCKLTLLLPGNHGIRSQVFGQANMGAYN